MSEKMISADNKALEVILMDYVERFGLTPAARQFFVARAAAEENRRVEAFPIPLRRSA